MNKQLLYIRKFVWLNKKGRKNKVILSQKIKNMNVKNWFLLNLIIYLIKKIDYT